MAAKIISKYEKEELRQIAQGRWLNLFRYIGIDDSFLRSQEGPCPKCRDSHDGSTRFKVFHEDEGACFAVIVLMIVEMVLDQLNGLWVGIKVNSQKR
ncbi:MAG: hypothetical protein COA78_11190 [Blastopirellula sp.]|nr:MAG: hypothetical protein COA78_11190 [Blastopirellula sp.]